MILRVLVQKRIPLIGVCSFGRSGSSFLMGILRASGLSVTGDFPFEDRTVQASFLNCLRIGFGDASHGKQEETKEIFRIQYRGESYLSSADLNVTKVSLAEEEFVRFLSQLPGDSSGIAEKFIGLEVLRLMHSEDLNRLIRPIFLLRDPRDIFVSIKEFNRRRGFKGFSDNNDDAALLRSICAFARSQIGEAARMSGFLCNYEDLVERHPQTYISLLRHIGASPSKVLIDRIWADNSVDGASREHMTSASQQDSLSRWKCLEFEPFWQLFDSCSESVAQAGYY